jgi:hypothetical protein
MIPMSLRQCCGKERMLWLLMLWTVHGLPSHCDWLWPRSRTIVLCSSMRDSGNSPSSFDSWRGPEIGDVFVDEILDVDFEMPIGNVRPDCIRCEL